MAQLVKDVMASTAQVVSSSDTVLEAARLMRDGSVGALLVLRDDQSLEGIVTDRDIAIRTVAEGRDPKLTAVAEVCSGDVATVSDRDGIKRSERTMRSKGVRRLAVMSDGRPVGIISTDDLLVVNQPGTAPAEIVSKARETAAKATKAARSRLAARIAGRGEEP